MEEFNRTAKMSANTFDPDRLAEQVRLAIGGRSLSRFAEEAGISKSYVSKIVNGKISAESPPSRKILTKMADPHTAVPQNGVTLADLFSSCGYSTEELIENSKKSSNMWTPNLCSSVQKYYNKALPMTAVGLLMNGLVLNGVEESMTVVTRSNYFEIQIPESGETYIGIPAFCRQRDAFELMYRTVLSALLVLSSKKATFYVLTDDREFYCSLVNQLKIPPEMRLALLYTEDYMFISEEYKVGDGSKEWNPTSVVNAAGGAEARES